MFDLDILRTRRVGRKSSVRTVLKPDPIYKHLGVAMLTNAFMVGGNKSVVYKKVILPAMKIIQEKTGADPTTILESALEQVSPTVELGTSGSSSHNQIPVDIKPLRSLCMGKRFICLSVRSQQAKAGKPTCEILASILIDSANGRGPAFERKEQLHRTAQAQTAFKGI